MRTTRSHDAGALARSRPRRTPAKLCFGIGALVLLAGSALACRPRAADRSAVPAATPDRAAPPAGEPQRSEPVAPAAPAQPPAGFGPLTGRWLREDGGYVLEIRSVSPAGVVDASYSNPRPIHVARAEALRAGAAVALFVELQDVNYPGSTYELVYDPARDVLEGTYFQALERQTFDVSFVRQ